MAALLLRLLALVAGLWLVRRLLSLFFRGAIPRGNRGRSGGNGPPAPNQMVKDPICGMYMDSRLAVQRSTSGGPVFFCSEECRNRYDSELS